MEALVATSRAISQDKFHERQIKRKYQNHLKHVDQISNKKSHPVLEHLKETETMAKTLYKSKSSAKKFYTTESNSQIKKQNRLLLQKIWNIESSLKCETTRQLERLQHVSGSNWHYKKRQAETIKEENRRMASNIINNKLQVKDYKKKIQSEIKQYLELRDQIRKFKLEDQNGKKSSIRSRKRINSERGLVRLRLNDGENENSQSNAEKNEKMVTKEEQERKALKKSNSRKKFALKQNKQEQLKIQKNEKPKKQGQRQDEKQKGKNQNKVIT